MRAFVIVTLLLLFAAILNFVRSGADFFVLDTLPLIGGRSPSLLWDGAAVAMILITIWGIRRLRRRGSDD